MRGLCGVTRQKEGHLVDDDRGHLNVGLGELEQKVDGMTLNFLRGVTQLVDDDV